MKSIPYVRILGALLIAAAVALHVYNVRAARARAQGADILRGLASAPALQLGIRADGADSAAGFRVCQPDAARAFLERLAAAEPGAPAKDATLGYDLALVLTNHVCAILRAVRAPGSDDLYVSLREPVKPAAGGTNAPSFREWPPALVAGAAPFLDPAP
jgi:hypothetical protein